MDGNKEDALKSLKIGEEALKSGNLERAKKFISKAQRLDPSLSLDNDLLSQLQQSDAANPTVDSPIAPQPKPSQSDHQQPSVRHRKASGSSSTAVDYTEAQVLVVKEIKRKKDYYEILGVEKGCSVDEVRKAYRKLSLKVHPDKNKAPGAEEAFKSVSKAFQCLSNEDSRRKYDVLGSDEPVYEQAPARRHRGNGFSNGFYYEADFDADEIFRQFFFGGMGQTTQFRGFNFGNGMGQHRNANANANANAAAGDGLNGSNFRMLIQLLPVLLILLLNFLPSSDPVYALSRQYPFEYKFNTPKGVNYYVKSTTKFEQNYPPNSDARVALEQRVEREYFSILRQNCQLEMQRRQWGFIRETPHCDMLTKFREAAAAAA